MIRAVRRYLVLPINLRPIMTLGQALYVQYTLHIV